MVITIERSDSRSADAEKAQFKDQLIDIALLTSMTTIGGFSYLRLTATNFFLQWQQLLFLD